MEHQIGISQIAGTAVIADALHGVGMPGALTAVALGVVTSLAVSAIEKACAAVIRQWRQAEEDAGTLEAGIPASVVLQRDRCACGRFIRKGRSVCARCQGDR